MGCSHEVSSSRHLATDFWGKPVAPWSPSHHINSPSYFSTDSESSAGSPRSLHEPLDITWYGFDAAPDNLFSEKKEEDYKIREPIEPRVPRMVGQTKNGHIYSVVDDDGDGCRIYQNNNRISINSETHEIKPFHEVFKIGPRQKRD